MFGDRQPRFPTRNSISSRESDSFGSNEISDLRPTSENIGGKLGEFLASQIRAVHSGRYGDLRPGRG
jgi:hypothetical protein